MTAYETLTIDFEAIDTHYADTVTLVSTDWLQGDEDYATFAAAILDAADADGLVSQNAVRVLLLEDTIDGPRCAIEHHRYSSLWSRACKEGLICRDGYDICTTSPTGNNGRMQRRYAIRETA